MLEHKAIGHLFEHHQDQFHRPTLILKWGINL